MKRVGRGRGTGIATTLKKHSVAAGALSSRGCWVQEKPLGRGHHPASARQSLGLGRGAETGLKRLSPLSLQPPQPCQRASPP